MPTPNIGTKLRANFGTMYPDFYGTITGIDKYGNWIVRNDDQSADSFHGPEYFIRTADIHEEGWTSPNGSPIGWFFTEKEAA